MCFALLLIISSAPLEITHAPFKVLTTYESLPEDTEEFLASPYTIDFMPNGGLIIVDSKSSRVHLWHKDGTYKKSFGNLGQGPGEIYFPSRVVTTNDKIWIWDYSGRLFSFDHEGNYIGMVHMGFRARMFAVLENDLILVAYHKSSAATDNRMIVKVVNSEGTEKQILKDYKNESYLKPREGFNSTLVKAFGPDVDIQRRGEKWYFGYSQDRVLHEINGNGQIVAQKRFNIPTEKPTDADKAYFKDLTYYLITGNTLTLSSLKNLEHNFDHNKSYYTHFLFKEDKVIFALTPLGGKKGCGNGFHRGSYYVNDWKTGEPLYRGDFNLPEGSAIYFRSGRTLAIISDEENEFLIQEIALKTSR